ncbi:AAA family ATPase [Ensifer sp. M14]|uniref:AAA family ATPase n=1 Tax=Ensifer sp. M14 TaxID=2203782 RepID=UPI0013146640|nr:AAA family ATPase [Ensifer sp. M14]
MEIWNFRGINHTKVSLPYSGKEDSKEIGSLVILGENAVGKTSILQALALGALGPDNAVEAGFSPHWCLRDGCDRGQVIVRFYDTNVTNSIVFERFSEKFGGEASIPTVVLGYGPYRLPARAPLSNDASGYEFRIRSLFDDRAVINGPYGLRQHFLRDGGLSILGDAVRTLNSLLLNRARAAVERGRLIIEDNGRRQRLSELSSGYKSILTLATDIMDVMYGVWSGMTSGQAVILIDEVDAHLHPAWRLTVVDALKEAFPLSQFVMTTHDPLVLRGLAKHEVIVLRRDQEDGSSVEAPTVPALDALTIDQMLTSDLFGLRTTQDAETAEQMTRYYKLLALPSRSPDENRQLDRLRASLPARQPMGNTTRERLFYAIIDRYLARAESRRDIDVWREEDLIDLVAEFELAEEEVLTRDS